MNRPLCQLAVLMSLCLLAPAPSAAQKPDRGSAVDLLLVLAVDVSDSISEREASLQRLGYADALTDPSVIAAIKSGTHGSIALTFLEWAGPKEQKQIIGWTRIDGEDSARKVHEALKSVPVSGGYWTSMSGALDKAAELIAAAPYTASRRVIDLSSDGRNNAGAPLWGSRKRILDKGITINGLPVRIMRRNPSFPPIPKLDEYFIDCVIGGPGAFSVVVENFKDLAQSVRRKLVREIAGGPAPVAGFHPVAGNSARKKYNCLGEPHRAGNLPRAG